jgi:molybdopterin converting factor subunit 1
MKVRVLLFAGLREKAGKGEMELEVEPGARVIDLPGKIFGAAMAQLPKSLRYAVNMDYVTGDGLLKEGDEVALIPPVAGG